MHKKKSSESVLAGEMILTFFNGGSEKRKLDPAFSVGDSLRTILRQNPQEYVYGEQIFNELIVAAWRAGAVRTLRITKDEFLDLLKCEGWNYDAEKHYWTKASRAPVSLFA